MNDLLSHKRVLSVDLASRGFGYVMFDGRKLVDWGVRRVKADKDFDSIGRIKDLLDWYAAEVLVLEDCQAPGSRRRYRIRRLSREVQRMAVAMDIQVVTIAWHEVRTLCGRSEKATKDQIAANVADLFPVLRRHLPPKRKIWMSEDERMNLFDAVALGVTARVVTGQDQAA